MFEILLIVLYTAVVIVALLLIGVILIQPSKSGGFGGSFGGVGESVFGAHAISHLSRLTVVLISLFFILTLLLAVITSHRAKDKSVAELNAIDGIECLPTDGTFYVFPNVEKLIARLDGINNDLAFSDYLIEKAGVALVPGSAFGSEGHIRISIATSMENLKNALQRIKQAI